jgi:hypothetical protein
MFTNHLKRISAIAALLAALGAGSASAHVVVRPVIALRPVLVRPVVVRPAITAREAARIRYQVHEHHQMQRMAAADGVITRREHYWLQRDAAQLRHQIHVARTN